MAHWDRDNLRRRFPLRRGLCHPQLFLSRTLGSSPTEQDPNHFRSVLVSMSFRFLPSPETAAISYSSPLESNYCHPPHILCWSWNTRHSPYSAYFWSLWQGKGAGVLFTDPFLVVTRKLSFFFGSNGMQSRVSRVEVIRASPSLSDREWGNGKMSPSPTLIENWTGDESMISMQETLVGTEEVKVSECWECNFGESSWKLQYIKKKGADGEFICAGDWAEFPTGTSEGKENLIKSFILRKCTGKQEKLISSYSRAGASNPA